MSTTPSPTVAQRTEASTTAMALARAYLVEVAPDEFAPTTDRSEATHVLIDAGDGSLVPETIGAAASPIKAVLVGGDTFHTY